MDTRKKVSPSIDRVPQNSAHSDSYAGNVNYGVNPFYRIRKDARPLKAINLDEIEPGRESWPGVDHSLPFG